MAKTTTHTWICDGCDEQSPHKGAFLPKGWMEGRLDTVNGINRATRFYLCETCSVFLYENRRKGHGWFERLKKVLKIEAGRGKG